MGSNLFRPTSTCFCSNFDREWIHRQNQFHKMGYRDGITEGQKDSAQEGFHVGFRQSVNVGYKWGLVRGVTSALASLPDSLKEKLSSVQEISADDAKMFHESICQSSHPSEKSHYDCDSESIKDAQYPVQAAYSRCLLIQYRKPSCKLRTCIEMGSRRSAVAVLHLCCCKSKSRSTELRAQQRSYQGTTRSSLDAHKRCGLSNDLVLLHECPDIKK
ncbi:hypothetical protein SETIT_1G083600v2 [Setaria italica]|uniref:Essential protein Yae1 N-terminal domain-containing protein n=1 Tax=Setaria italica TaxID=4555 RepID=A0A368PIG5_SETIT|nr:hypothetical protein SETIT_1G083600v2 [Setaria italica]